MDSHHRYSHLTIAVAVAFIVLATAWAAAAASPASGAIPHLQWTSIYRPPVNQDQWSDVAMGPSHTVYVCGTQNFGQGTDWLMTVAKFSAAKKLLWATPTIPGVKTWSDGGNGSSGHALAVDYGGNVIVVGSSFAPGGGFAVIKFSGADGHVLWQKDFMLVGPGSAADVVLDSSGNAYVTGTAVGGMSTGQVIYTAKFRASDGKKLWENLLGGPAPGPSQYGRGITIAIDAHRNTYVIGSAMASSTYDAWMVEKISPAGKRLWAHHWSGAFKHSDQPSCLAVSTSAVYVAGNTQTDTLGSYDAVLVKYNLSGRRLWTKQFKHAKTNAIVNGLCFDSYGHLLIAGLRHPVSTGPDRTFLAKLTTTGKTYWLRSQASPSNPLGAMAYYDIVKGPAGSMYLSGFEAPSATDTNILVEKRTSAGKVSWSADYGWQDDGDDDAGRLVRNGTTALYVCGEIWTTTTFYDATLQRFKP